MAPSSDEAPHRMLAELVYDTRTQPLSAGVRAAIQRARRLLYTADQAELVLQISPDRKAECLRLDGQLLDDGVPIEGAAVRLQSLRCVLDRATDDEGEFRVAELPKGSYDLEIETETRIVSITPLDID